MSLTIGAAFPKDDDWIVNLCPAFFEMAEMEAQLTKLAEDPDEAKAEICNLENMDTTGQYA